ncbi:MAG: NAD(P)/FAD-dependent oxidoreductase [Thermodesulfobacteriota bacterium]|nr:NAD(P)/FAD-dependent oxidoreductase [Thermodesulfobacteriota bacterium]
MAEEYDVVYIGSGHNGLISAAYLAKAGLKTINIDRREVLGGACATEEVTLPGFKHNTHSNMHSYIHWSPIFKDLEIAKYHKYIFPDPAMAMVFPDGKSIIQYVGQGIEPVDKTCKTLARFSPKDAKAYKDYYMLHHQWRDFYITWWYGPPLMPSQQFSLLEGTELGREILWLQMTSLKKASAEVFESSEIRAFMMMAGVQVGLGVEEYGTGLFLPLMTALEHDPGWGISPGGSNTIAQAIANVVKDHGGKILLNSEVVKIIVKNGIARGVELENGDKIHAKKAVVSNIDPQGTFFRLVGEENLEEGFLRQIRRWTPGISAIIPHYALNEPPIYKTEDPDVNKSWSVLIGESEEAVINFYRNLKDNEPVSKPEDTALLAFTNTLWDKSQAPEGKHTALYWLHRPYELKDGGAQKWHEVKEEVADLTDEVWCKYAPNMTKKNILKRHVESPLEIEGRMPHMFGGCWLMGDMTQDQMGMFRPFHGYPPYMTPIENLFMCGACTHPGGGVTGGPGYNSATAICDALKVKKWWSPITVKM